MHNIEVIDKMSLKEPQRALANFLHVVVLWAWYKHLNVNSKANIFINIKSINRVLNEMCFQPLGKVFLKNV